MPVFGFTNIPLTISKTGTKGVDFLFREVKVGPESVPASNGIVSTDTSSYQVLPSLSSKLDVPVNQSGLGAIIVIVDKTGRSDEAVTVPIV